MILPSTIEADVNIIQHTIYMVYRIEIAPTRICIVLELKELRCNWFIYLFTRIMKDLIDILSWLWASMLCLLAKGKDFRSVEFHIKLEMSNIPSWSLLTRIIGRTLSSRAVHQSHITFTLSCPWFWVLRSGRGLNIRVNTSHATYFYLEKIFPKSGISKFTNNYCDNSSQKNYTREVYYSWNAYWLK